MELSYQHDAPDQNEESNRSHSRQKSLIIERSPYCQPREIVQLLFPHHARALAFFDALVGLASSQAPFFQDQQDGYLHIMIPGYKELQVTLGFSYETIHMYSILFRAVGVLFIEREQGKMHLFIPSGNYLLHHDILMLFEDLCQHYEQKRPRMARLIAYVVQRLLAIQEANRLTFFSQEYSRVVYQDDPIPPLFFVKDNERKEQPIDGPETLMHVQPSQPASAVAVDPALLKDEQVGFAEHKCFPSLTIEKKETICLQGQSSGDTVMEMSMSLQNGCLPDLEHRLREDSWVDSPVDSGQRVKGDSWVDSRQRVKGDSSKNGNGNEYIDTHNNIIINYTDPDPVLNDQETFCLQKDQAHRTDSLRQQAEYIATVIEGHTANLGAYFVLLKRSASQIIRAAAIATLLRQHFPQGQRPLKRPGGFFTSQVHHLSGDQEQVRLLLQPYETLSYQQISNLLGTQAQEQGSDLRLYQPFQGTALNKAAAHQLAQRIRADEPSIEVLEIQPVPYSPSGSSVVSAVISALPHIFASVEDWNSYQQTTHTLKKWEEAREQREGRKR